MVNRRGTETGWFHGGIIILIMFYFLPSKMKIVQWLIKRVRLWKHLWWYQYCIYFDETVQYRIVYRHQIMTKSRAIWIQLKTGTIFVPSISSHLIPISLIFIFSSKISFSKRYQYIKISPVNKEWPDDLVFPGPPTPAGQGPRGFDKVLQRSFVF